MCVYRFHVQWDSALFNKIALFENVMYGTDTKSSLKTTTQGTSTFDQ